VLTNFYNIQIIELVNYMPLFPRMLALALIGGGFYLLSHNNIPELTMGIMFIFIGSGLLMISR